MLSSLDRKNETIVYFSLKPVSHSVGLAGLLEEKPW
jgi:hypothetical protein